MPRIRKYALEKYGPSWLSFCLPNSPPPLPPPPPPSSLPPSNRGPPEICQVNSSPWDVMTPQELQELNFDQQKPKEELGDDDTMEVAEILARNLAEDDDKKKKKPKKKQKKKPKKKQKKQKKKQKKTKRNSTSENTVNKNDIEKTKITKRRRTNSTVNQVAVTDTEDIEKKITKKRKTEKSGSSENTDKKVVDNSRRKSDPRLPQSRNIGSEKKEKPKKLKPVDFMVRLVCKNDFCYYI